MDAKYAFIDVETSGFDSLRHCVITLSCYVTDEDYNILGEHHGSMRPDGARDICWTEGAEKVHGISWERAMSFPPLKDAACAFLDFIRPFSPLTFVAHNAPFDKRMIKGSFSKVDLHFDLYTLFPETQDTVQLLKDSGITSGKSKSLGPVCVELGIAHDHHDAKSDAFVLIEIHRRCTQGNSNMNMMGMEPVILPGEEI